MTGEIDRFVGTFDVSAVRQPYYVTSHDSCMMSHGWHVQFQRALKLNVGRLMNFEDTNYTALCQIVEHLMSRDVT